MFLHWKKKQNKATNSEVTFKYKLEPRIDHQVELTLQNKSKSRVHGPKYQQYLWNTG